MSINASVLNKSIRPRRTSLTRGCDTRKISAASRCFRRRAAMSFCTWIMRSARTSRCSASSRRNPTSRKTLPVDAVMRTRRPTLASRLTLELSLFGECSVSLPCDLHIRFGRSPAPLLEGVQDVHGLCELCDVQDSVFQRCVEADLPDTRSHRRHRLPVRWVEPLLDTPKLKAGESPGVRRKGPNVGREEPSHCSTLSDTTQYASTRILCQA